MADVFSIIVLLALSVLLDGPLISGSKFEIPTVKACSIILPAESVARTTTSYELSVPTSIGFSKSGADLKVKAPVDESILNFEASAPPFRDQVTVLLAE